ncbi:MAG: GNAT family N-acetyltransferase [Nitrososphaerota archaeon]|jgi:GNAT superfamily N-acetyltransferase|uniref:GNAT family N-acetyltransferase n=1 Tax=Candidatus Bathycorpusculum sp. TaxID=2994959 RepID=UPI002836B032|nr:GNAT family N-acetyltransferase [Candidatus Termitimicrobium sp.]MCL2431604.1 GNAT family N-acetyltransferase [Candidatus Termitimicrobium sp.]MDR0493959.1 GNAT family N-acetyltransferase [Nitrososphaerota archaeon]
MNNIEFTDHISVSDYIELRKAVDFKPLSQRQAETALKNYVFLIVAKIDDKTVGMTRLIFDGAYIAVLVDVIILPEYQGHGIGKTMIEKTLAYLKNNIADGEQVLVMLMSAKDKEGFYEKFGFIQRPDETYGAGMSQWLLK